MLRPRRQTGTSLALIFCVQLTSCHRHHIHFHFSHFCRIFISLISLAPIQCQYRSRVWVRILVLDSCLFKTTFTFIIIAGHPGSIPVFCSPGWGRISQNLVIKITFTFIIIAGNPGRISVSLMSILILMLMLMLNLMLVLMLELILTWLHNVQCTFTAHIFAGHPGPIPVPL